jgi:dUTP pyrophosphatase
MSFRKVNLNVVNESANPLPKYETEGSAGADLIANEVACIKPGKMAMVDTGLRVAVPDGYELQVRSRSGLAAKKQVFVLNSPGTVDSDYRGLIKVLLFNAGEEDFNVELGDRIAQAVICPVYQADLHEVDSLDDTERGEGGFGHTGTKI